ncbi:MAG TPA: nuclear transport factor 2 family protein [Blastocatellia bacterium]|nr:nuclear transport factor 2 family protein [Blastocatellia bacterium]
MSEEQNTKLVQQIYDLFKGGDIQTLVSFLSEEVKWQLPDIENIPFSGKRSGREAVTQFFATVADSQDVLAFEPQQFVAQGDKVVALGRYSWRVRSTGREFESDFAHVFTVRDGKVVSFQEYLDTAAGLTAYQKAASA